MAFASMGVSEVKLGRGIPAFRVHGSTYHLMGPLVGSAHDQPKFAMLYFFDNNEATRYILAKANLIIQPVKI